MTRFLQASLKSDKYTKIIDNTIVADQDAIEADVDEYFDKILPIVAGLADSTEELDAMSTDQYLMVRELSEKVIEMKQDLMAVATSRGTYGDQPQTQASSPEQAVIDAMKGG